MRAEPRLLSTNESGPHWLDWRLTEVLTVVCFSLYFAGWLAGWHLSPGSEVGPGITESVLFLFIKHQAGGRGHHLSPSLSTIEINIDSRDQISLLRSM